jgi:endonuclease/exonuclease/phosphatase family metal-dependent hydrolase
MEDKMTTHFLAWWNVENLFDIENSPDRSDKLSRTLKNELKDWTAAILDKKLNRLASVINQMNDNKGPDLIGLCEIENKNVLKQLVAKLNRKSYGIVHADTKDERGIDVAFLYDKKKYKPKKTFFHFVLRRNATRDIVQVNFEIKETAKLLVVVGNHWPSRSGGQLESEPYRMSAGETLAYYHKRILEEHGDNPAIVTMGDFNDEPFNRSITDYALSENNPAKVLNAKNPVFFNLMWDYLAKGEGTFFFDRPNVLDQFLISKGILNKKSGFKYKENSTRIEIFPGMSTTGDYKKPVKFGRPGNGLNEKGFSDHFPISMVIEE